MLYCLTWINYDKYLAILKRADTAEYIGLPSSASTNCPTKETWLDSYMRHESIAESGAWTNLNVKLS